jgi:hypothetical protein
MTYESAENMMLSTEQGDFLTSKTEGTRIARTNE